jgi:hypothetical protein
VSFLFIFRASVDKENMPQYSYLLETDPQKTITFEVLPPDSIDPLAQIFQDCLDRRDKNVNIK